MIKRIGLPLLLSLILFPCHSQEIEIWGKAEQFSGQTLLVEVINNPILKTTTVTDTIELSMSGEFQKVLHLQKATWIEINSGIYKSIGYFEPGYRYELSLPANIPKSEADIRNPYFKPITNHLQIFCEEHTATGTLLQNGNDLNSRIYSFDTLIYKENQKMIEAIGAKKQFSSDSLINNIENKYKYDTSSYFKTYRTYRYGLIKINSRDTGLKAISDAYLPANKLETSDPAFMDLFGEMYKEFLFYFARSEEGKNIAPIINRKHSLSMLIDSIGKHEAILNDSMAELVIIKDISDNYTKNYFYKEALLLILDSLAQKSITEENARFAAEVYTHLTRLKTGTPPPEISLRDQNGIYKTLADFRGKYVYLNFCTPDNYSCLSEFPFMRAIYRVHKEHLEIITVMITEDYENMNRFMEKNDYQWVALFYENNDELLKTFDVRAYPTCYLLDPQGILVQSPATLTTEGFEQQLFRIMKSRGDL